MAMTKRTLITGILVHEEYEGGPSRTAFVFGPLAVQGVSKEQVLRNLKEDIIPMMLVSFERNAKFPHQEQQDANEG